MVRALLELLMNLMKIDYFKLLFQLKLHPLRFQFTVKIFFLRMNEKEVEEEKRKKIFCTMARC